MHVVAVGTGQALAIGARGDADALLVHDRIGEDKFVADGFGIDRRDVMYNDFVIVGPNTDPAHIRGLKDARKALTQIAGAKAPCSPAAATTAAPTGWSFGCGSRPASSPTRIRGWYRDLGQGMGPTLNIAAAMNAYTLTDRATWANFKNRQSLEILTEGDPALFNPYGSILVNPAKWPKVKSNDARTWHEWLTSKAGLDAITSYKINGEELFFPPRSDSDALTSFKPRPKPQAHGAHRHRQHDQDHAERQRQAQIALAGFQARSPSSWCGCSRGYCRRR